MTRLENLTNYLEKARVKPVYNLAQEVDQKILILRLKTWIKDEERNVFK